MINADDNVEVVEEFPPRSIDPGLAPLFKALAKAQAEIGTAKRMQFNPFMEKRGQKSMYADLNDTWNACREALTKNGLCVIQMPTADGPKVTVTTILGHESGASIQSSLTMTSVEYDPQTIGKLITYARRYALQAFAGIAAEDDDATNASGKDKAETDTAAPKQTKKGKAEPQAEKSWGITWEDPVGSNQWFDLEKVIGLDNAKKTADKLAAERNRDIYVTDANSTEYIAHPPKSQPVAEEKSGSGQADSNGRLSRIKLEIDNAKKLIGGSNRSAGLELTAFLVEYMGNAKVPAPSEALEEYEAFMPLVIKALSSQETLDKFKKDPRGFGITLSGKAGDALDKEFDIWKWVPETRSVARKLYDVRHMESAADFRNYIVAITADKMEPEDAMALMRVALATRNAYKLLPLVDKIKMPMHTLVEELEKIASITPTQDPTLAKGQEAALDYAIENLSNKITTR